MSFRLKTILGVALIEAVLLGALLTFGWGYLSSSAEAEFGRRAEATLRAYGVAAKEPLIASDLAALLALTRDMLNYPGVVFAQVRDADRRVVAEAGQPGDPAGGVREVRSEVTQAGVTFGYLEVGVSTAELAARLGEARRFGLAVAFAEMALVAMFSWFLGSYLTRQLSDLSEASTRLAGGDLGLQIAVRGADELAATAASFNRMSTRLRETYAELDERARDLRLVLENIVDGIVTVDAEGSILSASPAVGRIFGCASGELAGTRLANLFEGASGVDVAAQLAALQGQPLPAPMPARARAFDGRPLVLEVQLSPLEGVEPRPGAPAALAVLRDVSRRVRTEEQLHLRGRIIESTTVGIALADATDPGRPILDANPAFARMAGRAREALIGQPCAEAVGAGAAAGVAARLRQAVADAAEASALVHLQPAGADASWLDVQLMPIRDPQTQRVTHLVAMQTDVSERVRAQQAVAAREAYLRQVFDATHDGIIVIDERGIVESFNAGAERMFGYAADEVIGRNVALIVPEPHKSLHDAYLRRYHETGESHIMGVEREFDAVRKDGAPLWLALRVRELELGGGRRFIGVVHDITERKRSEDELREAKEAAEDAASAKAEFLANMSHEIRTPMHGVLGSIEMLRETPLNGQQRRHLDTAATSATLLLGVIDEILDFSRLEAGKLRIEALDFDLRQTVEDVTAMLAQRAHVKRIELACYIAPDVPGLVRGDPIRLRQVLVNLMGNAIKFTERGEVVVTVACVPGEQDPVLRFEVRDTGIGIAADRQARLFEPFTQADSSTSRRFGGSGLGLSIAKRLVELMGGHIGLSSQEGSGSTFWFTLRAPAVAARSPAGPADALFAGTRVLVVDDNATNRIILHRYLTSWGSQSSSASGGDEALAKLQDAAAAGRPYDLVLLDLNMPGMDGYELMTRIQADAAIASTPLIMLSSSVQDPVRMAGRRVEIWLDKPVRQSDLHDAIATVLRDHAPRAGATAPAAARTIRFDGERVLLVEDNPTTADVGTHMLRSRGLEVTRAGDGAAAVEAVRGGSFDVVLMDIQMPGMDGYQATHEIRALEARQGRARLPIIALTAHAMPIDRQKCLDAGMDDYLVKPYSGDAVAAVIARWLGPPGAARAEAAASVIDRHRLAEVRAVMGEDLPELARRFCDGVSSLMERLDDAAARADTAGALELAHRLKNTAGDIGAARLHAMAGAIERALAARPAGMPALDELRRACNEAVAAVRREVLEQGNDT